MLPCNYSERLRVDSDLMNATGTVSDGIAGLSALHLVSANATAHKVSIVRFFVFFHCRHYIFGRISFWNYSSNCACFLCLRWIHGAEHSITHTHTHTTRLATLPHLSTQQAVAMLPHALVHLVAGAQCRAGAVCGRIVTTIENKDARGSVYVACSGTIVQQVALGTLRETRSNCSWVWHDSIGYLLPADTEVMLTNGAEPSIPGAHALFSIAIAHTPR